MKRLEVGFFPPVHVSPKFFLINMSFLMIMQKYINEDLGSHIKKTSQVYYLS